MTNRAAIRWLLKGPHQPPVIQYMLLDSSLDYLIYPKELSITHLKRDIWQVLEDIEMHSNDSLEVYYKSINMGYGRHRKDSGQFHRLLKKYLRSKNLLRTNSRLAFVLKNEQLQLFKKALYFLDIDSKTRGNAFITYLWMIALKATRSRVMQVIKHIWKARLSISRMNKMHEKKFQEFCSLLK